MRTNEDKDAGQAAAARRTQSAFAAVDWGTSSFRGWLMSAGGEVLAESRGSEGMLHCSGTGFAPVLRDHLARLGAPEEIPVLICGMAGARQGWIEAPYLKTPTRLDALHEGAIRVDAAADIRILPGLAQARADRPDVMRGEETQLLGVTEADFTGLVCIPGTHSKWIRIEAGAVTEFSTYMTGELFSVISQHSILVHAIETGEPQSADGRPFRDGVAMAQTAPSGLTASLFRLRAAQLLGFEQRSDGAARLSGLLIGAEIADAVQRHGARQALRLIGAGGLGGLYEVALREAGFDVSVVDAEGASRRGLAKAAISIWESKGLT
ncbi:2-dehydro-3-deoxygalactonokinase [Bradyrhizobium sp.]|uniref:2-dehydro-3-deoxygalactonokinase n=1 Tax=Bradyrhizobium sp. TaxID=376 RepID=UPI001ED4A18A|nr:2-dehydro-3-deoxygalactonokinase [Bradyrhizobium sp.]MBV9980456.1 2-dehydro-3-deoxygalactonokinase [Bradyrhizobium sp.]